MTVMASKRQNSSNDEISRRIVVAAARHFIEDGFEGASTANIASTARTSKREIYQRFENKEALFEEVMAHLCASVDDQPSANMPSLETSLQEIAMAVLMRFMQTQTRGVLISAIGASNRFPGVPQLFWQEGPGQAVDAIVNLLKGSPQKNRQSNIKDLKVVAERYIFECCGGFVLAYLFNESSTPSDQEMTQHVAAITRKLLDQLGLD